MSKPAQAEAKPAKAKNQWTNFSLYGLDNEDEQDSNKRRNSSHAWVIFFFVLKYKTCEISTFTTINKISNAKYTMNILVCGVFFMV